jgi:hypothetical protein
MVNRVLVGWVLAIGLVAAVVIGVVSVSSAPTSATSCVQSPDYGKQCETISGNGLTVTNIEAQFTAFPDFLGQLAWTFETTTYQCDPRGRPKSECPPEERMYGTLHRPNPHTTAETVCSAEGAGIGGNRCSGSLRFPLPQAFTSMRWICVEVAVRVNGKWVDNGAGIPQGNRACRQVH